MSMSLSPNCKLVALSFSDRAGISLLDVQTGDEQHRLKEVGTQATNLVFSPDSSVLVATVPSQMALWYTTTGQGIRSFFIDERHLVLLVFSPDGRTVAGFGFSNIIRLWDTSTGQETRRFERHVERLDDISFSPDGKMLASASAGRIRLWDARHDQEHTSRENQRGSPISFFIPRQTERLWHQDRRMARFKSGTHEQPQ